MILRHIKTGVTIDTKHWEIVGDSQEKVFTTYDGVDVVFGQKFWFVVNSSLTILRGINYIESSECTYFFYEKKAIEYVQRMRTENFKKDIKSDGK